jgi:hypothetical protein
MMGEDITETDNLPPRDLRIFLLCVFRDPAGSFPKNLQMVKNPYLDKFIPFKYRFSG